MKHLRTKAAVGLLTVGVGAGLAFLAFILAPFPQGTAQAEPAVSIGVDANPYQTPENQATSLGTIQGCIGNLTIGIPFDIDIYIKDVPESLGLLGFDATLQYDGTKLKVTGKNVSSFLAAGTGSSVAEYSMGVPDESGNFRVGAEDQGSNHDWGEGVLARLTLEPKANGVSSANVWLVTLTDSEGNPLGPTDQYGYYNGPIFNADIAVGESCPDRDDDTVLDAEDNCPDDANPNQEDDDDDDIGDVCDSCRYIANWDQTDTDGDCLPSPYPSDPSCGDVCDNCPWDANTDQSDIDGDGGVDGDGDTMFNEDPTDGLDNDGDTWRDEDGGGGDVCDVDADGDGYVNTREIAAGSNTLDPNSTPEVCDGVDNDGDCPNPGGSCLVPVASGGCREACDEGFPDSDSDGTKDCLDPDADTDGDTTPDPSDLDDDTDGDPDAGFNDGFEDTREHFMGTDSLDDCPDSASDEAWPADFDNSCWVNIMDIGCLKPVFMSKLGGSGPKDFAYDRRYDLDASGWINILDIGQLKPFYNKQCTNY